MIYLGGRSNRRVPPKKINKLGKVVPGILYTHPMKVGEQFVRGKAQDVLLITG